ncbi:hypothetical protein T439DRAFT_326039 [Meredithblackwellia eburnea MCA 4105]
MGFVANTGAGLCGEEAPEGGTGVLESDEDEGWVEGLLWKAQLELINHRRGSATEILRKAVNLGSSAACATLGNILINTIRDELKLSPPSTPPSSLPRAGRRNSISSPIIRSTAIEAFETFLEGLERELEKATAPAPAVLGGARGSHESSHLHYFGATGGVVDEDEDETEGRYFALDRLLDLVIGLTTICQLEVLTPFGADRMSTKLYHCSEELLWARGAQLTSNILQHPLIDSVQPCSKLPTSSSPASSVWSFSPEADLSTQSSFTTSSLPIPIPNALQLTQLSPVLVASLLPHSFAPSRGRASPRSLNAESKLRNAIEVHSLYFLSLFYYSVDRCLSMKCWEKIVTLTSEGGGRSVSPSNAGIAFTAQQAQKFV